MPHRMRRESLTLRVNLSDDDVLMLANALEMYPDAVHLHVYQYELTRRSYWNSKIIGTVYDGNQNSERDYDPDERNPQDLSWDAIVKLDRYETGIHLEQAPDEWTELVCPYSYSSPALMHARNHVPSFDRPATVPSVFKAYRCEVCGNWNGISYSFFAVISNAHRQFCGRCRDTAHSSTLNNLFRFPADTREIAK